MCLRPCAACETTLVFLRLRSHTPEANTNVFDDTRIGCETKTIHHCGLPVACHLVQNSATEIDLCDII